MYKSLSLFLFSIFLSVLLLIIILFFNNRDERAVRQLNDLAYYEIAREDHLCTDYCFLEYIVQSNGIILEKRETEEEGKKNTSINLWHIKKSEARDLISNARDLLGQHKSDRIDCTECVISHIFFADQAETVAYTVLDSERPDFIDKIQSMTERSIDNAIGSDDFFVHFAYASRNSNIVDYHIFSDGLVLKELFGDKNGELIEANIYYISDEKMKEIKSFINEDIFKTSGDPAACSRRDLLWGFFELKNAENYRQKYTCGGENNDSDKFFDNLYNKIVLKK
jgi:hypothetical protein